MMSYIADVFIGDYFNMPEEVLSEMHEFMKKLKGANKQHLKMIAEALKRIYCFSYQNPIGTPVRLVCRQSIKKIRARKEHNKRKNEVLVNQQQPKKIKVVETNNKVFIGKLCIYYNV